MLTCQGLIRRERGTSPQTFFGDNMVTTFLAEMARALFAHSIFPLYIPRSYSIMLTFLSDTLYHSLQEFKVNISHSSLSAVSSYFGPSKVHSIALCFLLDKTHYSQDSLFPRPIIPKALLHIVLFSTKLPVHSRTPE